MNNIPRPHHPHGDDDRLLTIDEVSELTRICVATLRWMRHTTAPARAASSRPAGSCTGTATSSTGSTATTTAIPSRREAARVCRQADVIFEREGGRHGKHREAR
jgi:hypothetical protein